MSRLEKALEAIDNARLPDIDFEEYLQAQEQDKDRVRRPVDFAQAVLDILTAPAEEEHGAKMPWHKTHSAFRFRPGEVTMWSGYNGHKKSMVLGYASLGFIRQGEPVAVASFEMKPTSTLLRMIRQSSGKKKEEITEDDIADFVIFSNEKFWIYDHQGSLSPERLYGVIAYCAKERGVKHFIIDSLMRVIPGEDDYNAQKNFVTRLCDLAIQLDIHIHLVHHTKKGKETEPSGRYDAKGSGAISDNVHNSLVVWSNKDKNNHDVPDVVVKCDKQREGEWEGSISLWFEEDSLRFVEYPPNKEI